MGPYHQLQDWPVPVCNTDAIVTGISTTVDSAKFTAKKFKHSNVGWGENNIPPSHRHAALIPEPLQPWSLL